MKNLIKLFSLILLCSFTFNCLSQCCECTKTIALNSGLVACYPLDGNADDMISPANNGAATNTVATTNRFGRTNAAFQFNGNAKIILPGANFVLNNYTYSAWVKIASNPTTGNASCVMSFGNSSALGDQNILLCNNYGPPNQIGFNAVSYTNPPSSPNPPDMAFNNTLPSTGVWYHLVSVRNTAIGKLRIYINGVQVAEKSLTSATAGYATPVVGTIGSRTPTGTSLPFNGIIDNVRIYNRALSNVEINDLYNLPDENPTGLTSFTILSTLKVYPNPAHDFVYIDNGQYIQQGSYTLKITNTLGQIVFNHTIDQQEFDISASTLGGAGAYFLQVINSDNKSIETKKIILN